MNYPSEFSSNIDPDNKTGYATFHVDGKKYSFILQCFEDYGNIHRMLDAAWRQGREGALRDIQESAKAAIDKRCKELRS
jgi:hypothetical protein